MEDQLGIVPLHGGAEFREKFPRAHHVVGVDGIFQRVELGLDVGRTTAVSEDAENAVCVA